MALFFDSWLVELGTVLIALIAGLYIYLLLIFQYWKKKGIPYVEPSFPFGNVKDMVLLRTTIGDTFASLYWQLEGHKLGGIYQMHRPVLLLRDPEIIKTFLVKDFAYFHDHGMYFDEESDPLSAHLFLMEGTKWKHLRYKLTRTFTSGKMKMMYPLVAECGKELKDYLASIAGQKETIEIKNILEKYTTDVIATCAFGIQSNCLKDPDSEFRKMGQKFWNPQFMQAIRDMVAFLDPNIAKLLKIRGIPRDVTSFFLGIVKETIEYREKFQVFRNDFMQLLISIKNKKKIEDPLELVNTMEVKDEQKTFEKNMYDANGMTTTEAAAQAFVFFIAGFETSSTTMSFCMYELALNPKIQDRLRDEIDYVMADNEGQLTYEAILKMEYLDRVVSETLRKYPPLPLLMRSCTKEYELPGSKVEIERDTFVIIPIHAIHHDPQYYPNPEVFDPERFTEEAKSQRHHYVYLPFGVGPRICIGSRFGLMQTKVGLASLISSYQVNVCKKTAIPLVMNPRSLIMAAKEGIHLEITNRVKA